MPMRQTIWARGWTQGDVRRAIAGASDLVAGRLDDLAPEDRELVAEFVRWLRFGAAVDNGVDKLVYCINNYWPLSENLPNWDDLHVLLLMTPETELLDALRDRYADPVQTLITFLSEVAPRHTWTSERGSLAEWQGDEAGSHGHRHACERAVQAHRCALEALLRLGTMEGILYALSRLDMFDWENIEVFKDIVQSHTDTIKQAARELWPRLDWERRADVVLFLQAYNLIDDYMLELVLSADGEALGHREQWHYLEALGNFFDPRVLPRLHKMFDHILDEFSAGDTSAMRRLINSGIFQFDKLNAQPTPELRQRTEGYGIPWQWELG